MTQAGPVGRVRRQGIGQVLADLRTEFPNVSVSKLRFLEAEGLVLPERTPAGYRKFSASDVARLRYVLRVQRDHYLPLKVIREHLDAMDRGLEPPEIAGAAARAPRPPDQVEAAPAPVAAPTQRAAAGMRLSREELLANSGLSEQQLDELETYGLIEPLAGTAFYDTDALVAATALAGMAGYGLEPRHLRVFKSAADRQVGLVEQVTASLRPRRGSSGDERASEATDRLVGLAVQLHEVLMRRGLRNDPHARRTTR